MFDIFAGWDTSRYEAMARYVELLRQRDELEAQIAQSLADVVAAYRWPNQMPMPAGTDRFKAEHISGEAFAEDLTGELAVANKTGLGTAHNLVRDIIGLTGQFPGCWSKVTSGEAPLWQARRITQEATRLPKEVWSQIDEAMAPALGAVGPANLFRLLDATLQVADQDGARLDTPAPKARYVHTGGDDADPTTGWISARVGRSDAIYLDAIVQQGADKLAADGETGTIDELRAKALSLLANPAAAVQFFGVPTTRGMNPPPACQADIDTVVAEASKLTSKFTPVTQVFVHLWATDMWDEQAVARLDRVGPLLVDRVADITQGSTVKLTPAIHIGDDGIGVDMYEIPTRIRQQVLLRNPYDVFPYSSTESRHLDVDHTVPYQPKLTNQTRLNNLAPLSRKAHRLKTHAGWHLEQPKSGVFIWHTAANQLIKVDNTGSHPVRPDP